MQKLLIDLLKSKLKRLFQKFKKDRILLVFVGNNRVFYDNFSFDVLKSFKENLPQTSLKVCCCFARYGIYGKNYATLKQKLLSFNGLVLLIDSGICASENELGLFKIFNNRAFSVADLNFPQYSRALYNANNQQDFISIVYYSLDLKSGRAINEQTKRQAAKLLSNIFCQVLGAF